MIRKRLFQLSITVLLFGSGFSQTDCPTHPSAFLVQIRHLAPHCQGKTNTCWAFSTLSFLESEILRETGQSVRLSTMWISYHAWLEKAKNYFEKQGEARLFGGGLAHDVLMVINRYGIVRSVDFPGRLKPDVPFNHTQMDSVLQTSLKEWVQQPEMTPEKIFANTRQVLNRYLGTPPKKIEVAGREMTSLAFALDYLKLDLSNYIQLTSFLSIPFYEFGKLELADNWLGYERYLNVPLDVFVELLNLALKQNYSAVIDMDLSEDGYDKTRSCAKLVPRWLSADSVNQSKREIWFKLEVTTDDHLQHVVGFLPGPQTWYLIKDSLPSSNHSASNGYIYMREDYLRMKVLSFMVHREAIQQELAERFDFKLPE